MKINYKQIIRSFCLTGLMLCAAPLFIAAQNAELEIPAKVKQFVEKDRKAIAVESADLNGDDTKDFILVTEKAISKPLDDDNADDERALLIIVSDRAGDLNLVKQNKNVVYCKSCGGVMGDPFAGIEVKKNGFTVNNYGGSSWRWSESYEFRYSRRDKTWQLVRSITETFRSFTPEKIKRKILLPVNFGKIDIADFDPSAIGKSK